MIYYLLFCLLSFYSQKEIELNIYKYSLEENTLTLYYCIKNNTDSVRTFVKSDYSTLHYVESLTLLITESDTISLHIQNPFFGFLSGKVDYVAIDAHDSICNKIKIQLNELYTSIPNPPHQITGICSFQLIYQDSFIRRGISRKYDIFDKNGKKIKDYKPIADSLYSNIIYIDRK